MSHKINYILAMLASSDFKTILIKLMKIEEDR